MSTIPTDSAAERICRVTQDYRAEYTDPISVEAGEPFVVSKKTSAWNKNPEWIWVWCIDRRGKSGWVPKNIIQMAANGKTGTTHVAYNATEFTVSSGQELTVEQEESGWFWCRDQSGRRGWVPISHVIDL